MKLTLEIFGKFEETSVPGLRRGFFATALLLGMMFLVALCCSECVTISGMIKIVLAAVAVASSLSVLEAGTSPKDAAVYGACVGAVVSFCAALATGAPVFPLCVLTVSAAVLCSLVAGLTYRMNKCRIPSKTECSVSKDP
jgi:hypothetical protein